MAIAVGCLIAGLVAILQFHLLAAHPQNGFSFIAPSPGEVGKAGPNFPGCCKTVQYPKTTTEFANKFYVPGIIVPGAQKAGTDFMWSLLACHPSLKLIGEEGHFFDMHWTGQGEYRQYLKKFGKKSDGKVAYDKTPSYLLASDAPCKIKSAIPDVKLIFVLRDPVDRFHSQLKMERSRDEAGHKITLFDVANRSIADLKRAGCSFQNGTAPRSWGDCFGCWSLWDPYCKHGFCSKKAHSRPAIEYAGRGLYAAQLAWWLNFFKPEQMLIFRFEDLVKDPRAAIDRVTQLVGVPPMTDKNFAKCNLKPHPSDKYSDPTLYEGKRLLYDFYEGPNRELDQLLKQHGMELAPFVRPTDDELRAQWMKQLPKEEQERLSKIIEVVGGNVTADEGGDNGASEVEAMAQGRGEGVAGGGDSEEVAPGGTPREQRERQLAAGRPEVSARHQAVGGGGQRAQGSAVWTVALGFRMEVAAMAPVLLLAMAMVAFFVVNTQEGRKSRGKWTKLRDRPSADCA